jgi:hypothetical protein
MMRLNTSIQRSVQVFKKMTNVAGCLLRKCCSVVAGRKKQDE